MYLFIRVLCFRLCAKFIQVVRRRQTPTVPSHFYVILYFFTQAAKCFLKQLYEESGSIHTLCETKAISTRDRFYLPTYLPTCLSDCLFYLISPLKDFYLPIPTVNSFYLSLWTILLQVSRTSKKNTGLIFASVGWRTKALVKTNTSGSP